MTILSENTLDTLKNLDKIIEGYVELVKKFVELADIDGMERNLQAINNAAKAYEEIICNMVRIDIDMFATERKLDAIK